MAVKITQVKKYVCSDGTEFIGGENRSKALAHERKIANSRIKLAFEKKIAEIVGANCFLEAVDSFDNSDFKDSYKSLVEAYQDNFFDSELEEDIERLFDGYTCPDDLMSFNDMADMIVLIVNNFGGIRVIEELYEFMKEHG
jgi:hypothetical protein